MDEMRITTGFMKGIIAKAIKKIIKKKFGVDVTVSLNDFYISNDDKVAKIHLNVNAEMDSKSLAAITSTIVD
jgi:pantothenate kinase-related protein Tda10